MSVSPVDAEMCVLPKGRAERQHTDTRFGIFAPEHPATKCSHFLQLLANIARSVGQTRQAGSAPRTAQSRAVWSGGNFRFRRVDNAVFSSSLLPVTRCRATP